MKRIIFYISIFLILILTKVYAGTGKLRIAVLDLKPVAISANKAKVVSDLLRTELVNTGYFLVLERNQMEAILNEIGFQEKGCTDASCALEIGKMLTANKIVIGTLTKLGEKIILMIRMVDVEKSTVDFAGKYIVERESDLIKGCSELAMALVEKVYGVKINFGGISWKETNPGKGLVKKGDVCGVVVSVKGNSAILNFGTNQGVKKNQKYKIIEYNEKEYLSKITGEKKKIAEKKKVGMVTITRVEPEFSIGRLETKKNTKNVIAKDVVYLGIAKNLGYKAGFSLSSTLPSGRDIIHSAYFSYEIPKVLFKISVNFEDLYPYELYENGLYKRFKYYFDQVILIVAYKPVKFFHIGGGLGWGSMRPAAYVIENYLDIIEYNKEHHMTELINMGFTIPLFGPPNAYFFFETGLIYKIGTPYCKQYSDGSAWVEMKTNLPLANSMLHFYGSFGVGF